MATERKGQMTFEELDGLSTQLENIANVVTVVDGEDITENLQNALDTTENPYVPDGTFYIDRIEFTKENTHLTLSKNAKLILNDGVNEEAIEILADGCSISNLQLDGNRDNQTGAINTLHGLRVVGNQFSLYGDIYIEKCGDSGITVVSVDDFNSFGKITIVDCEYISFFAISETEDHSNIYIQDIEVYWEEYAIPERTAVGMFGGLGVSKWNHIVVDKIKTTYDDAWNVFHIGFTTKSCNDVKVSNCTHYGGSASVSFAAETENATLQGFYSDTPLNEANGVELAGVSNCVVSDGTVKGSALTLGGVRLTIGNGISCNDVVIKGVVTEDCLIGIHCVGESGNEHENTIIDGCHVKNATTGIQAQFANHITAQSNVIDASKNIQIDRSNHFNACGNIFKDSVNAVVRVTSSVAFEHNYINVSNNIIPVGTIQSNWFQVLNLATLGSECRFENNINTDRNIRDVLNDVVEAYGNGTPEASITANVGSKYSRKDGGASTTLYVKESGTGNTGWVAK